MARGGGSGINWIKIADSRCPASLHLLLAASVEWCQEVSIELGLVVLPLDSMLCGTGWQAISKIL